ncbi:MAG: HIT domain-containing protein [Balneola sp.]|nr:HIT domain-containing protein [Balneola sp.]MBO6650236.1 HIT domain-containing protein [Balneola sp.]MBO6712179.1 HIT domain-containing protein [Balneola sp.]MBO6800373.1 HIT domain-containing protein [Balneola sp.]MBO6871835.1 HIT domain-containing protein [Balneola sp.]
MASIFSKIIKGEIPCYKIAENEDFFSFLDINPIAEGHTLVIPKKEVDYVFDLSDESLHGLISFSKKIAKAIDRSLGTIRTGIIVEGLEVPHAHIHLIPIYFEGQPVSLGRKTDVSESRMTELASLISNAVEL